MSAQPVHRHLGPVPAIPRTIDAVANALNAPKRMAFYAEVGQTDAAELESTIERWWADAMLDQVPGREERFANVMAGRNLVSLDSITDRAQGTAEWPSHAAVGHSSAKKARLSISRRCRSR